MYLLLGYGISNQSIAKYFDKVNLDYIIFDDKYYHDTNPLDIFRINTIEVVVKSGGISNEHLIIVEALKKSIEIVSDLELFYRLRINKNQKLVAVTGTNGKSTTISLLHHMLPNTKMVGNIGIPIFDYIESSEDLIIEVSSYMGEYLKTFKPDIGVFLNFNSHHLDHHKTIKNYLNAKINIFKNMSDKNYLIFESNKQILEAINEINCQKIMIVNKAFVNNPLLKSYIENVNAALEVIKIYHYLKCLELCESYQGLEHRLEMFHNFQNIIFYNDSKSTNIYALNRALSVFSDKKILLICGGKIHEEDLKIINKPTKVICNGENRYQLFERFNENAVECYMFINLQEVINNLEIFLEDIDIVLFSPGAQSFDQFQNFEERGNFFKKEIILKFGSCKDD